MHAQAYNGYAHRLSHITPTNDALLSMHALQHTFNYFRQRNPHVTLECYLHCFDASVAGCTGLYIHRCFCLSRALLPLYFHFFCRRFRLLFFAFLYLAPLSKASFAAHLRGLCVCWCVFAVYVNAAGLPRTGACRGGQRCDDLRLQVYGG